MEEDEDVVLEGAAIHQYLNEIGYNDFEVFQSQNNSMNLKKTMTNVEDKTQKFKGQFSIFRFLKAMLLMFIGLETVHEETLESVTLTILKEKILEEEHLLIIENVSENMHKLSADSFILQKMEVLQKFSFKLLLQKMCFISTKTIYLWFCCTIVFLMFNFCVEASSTFISYTGILAFGSLFLFRSAALWWYHQILNKFHIVLRILQKANNASTKCLKFFNELYVIARGFNQNDSESELLGSRYRECLAAEHTQVFLLLSSMLNYSRSRALSFKLTGIESLEVLFSEEYTKNQVGNLDSDNLLFHTLKEQRKKMASLTSCFLAELLLYFEFSRNFSLLQIISTDECQHLDERLCMLLRLLEASKKSLLEKEPELKKLQRVKKQSDKQKTELLNAVDSLSIRCRGLAQLVLSFQDFVEDIEIEEYEGKFYEPTQVYCQDIHRGIAFSKNCLDDVQEKLDSILNKSIQSNIESELNMRQPEEVTLQPKTEKITPLGDRVIVDEVFEAFVEETSNKTNVDTDEHWTQNAKIEKKAKNKQRERCKRVLMEIKPILQSRRRMWEEREDKALRRMAPASNDGHSPVEECSLACDSGVSSPVSFNSFAMSERIQSPEEAEEPPRTSDLRFCDGRLSVKAEEMSMDSPSLSEEEGDSDEERLLLYRKVRKELDEDEAIRGRESEDTESDEMDSFGGPPSPLKAMPKNSALSSRFSPCEDVRWDQELDKSAIKRRLNLPHLQRDGESKEQFEITERDNSVLNDRAKPSLALIRDTDGSDMGNKYQQKYQPNNDETRVNLENVKLCRFLDDDEDKELSEGSKGDNCGVEERKKENFSCGESSSDEGESRVLDWSTSGFRREQIAPVEGIPKCVGFPSVVSSHLFAGRNATGEEEVFGGLGEGESETSEEESTSTADNED